MTIWLVAQSQTLGTWLIAVAVVLITATMLISVRKKMRGKSDRPRLDAGERLERMKQVHGMKDDLRTMMVELEELTRRFSAQLDAKAIRLEKLIEEADRRITAMNGDSPIAGGRMIGKGAKRRDGAKASSPPVEAPAERAEASDAGAAEPEGEALDSKVVRIYELADAGRSPVQIAGDLHEQVGKIELILALRRT